VKGLLNDSVYVELGIDYGMGDHIIGPPQLRLLILEVVEDLNSQGREESERVVPFEAGQVSSLFYDGFSSALWR